MSFLKFCLTGNIYIRAIALLSFLCPPAMLVAGDNPPNFDEILQLRVDVEDSANCSGSNSDPQTVTDDGKVTGGQQNSCPIKLAITVEGSVETQDAPFDYVYINDTLYFSGNDDDAGCPMTTKTETKVITVKPGETITLSYDTSDGQFHSGAYAKVTKVELVEETCQSGCQPGQGSADNGSLDLSLNLGRAAYGESIGALRIAETLPSAILGKPASLRYNSGWAGVDVIRDSQNAIRQVKTPQILADVVTETALRFRVNFYTAAQTGALNGGLYNQAGKTPYVSWVIENLNASTNGQVRISQITGSITKVSEFTWNAANQGWDLVTGNGLRKISKATTTNSGTQTTTITKEVRNELNQLISKDRKTFKQFPWGRELIQTIVDPDGAAITTDYAYYENQATDGASYTRIKSQITQSGEWVRYEYDGSGRLAKTIEPFLNAAPSAADSLCKVTSTLYQDSAPQETTVIKIQGQEVERRYKTSSDDSSHITREIVCTEVGASYDASTNLVTETRLIAVGPFTGEKERVVHPDGTAEIYAYSINSGTKTTTVNQGVWNGSSINQGRQTVTTTDQAGNLLSETVTDIESGLELSSKVASVQDELGRPTRIDYGNGTFETASYGCCGPDSRTDVQGIVTGYTYDNLNRLETETRAGVTLRYKYDALDRLTRTQREAAGSTTVTISGASYDVAGRQTTAVDILGTTGVAEVRNSSGTLTRTETLPDGISTKVTVLARDGQLLSESGSASRPRSFDYGAVAGKRWIKETKTGWQGSTGEWVKRWTDLAGRDAKVEYPDGAESNTFYNGLGQVERTVDASGLAIIYDYSPLGDLEGRIVDVDQSGGETGSDRVSRSVKEIVTAHGVTVERRTTSEASESGDVVTGIDERTPDGLKRWQSSFGLPAAATTVVYNGSGSRTETTTLPDTSTVVRSFQNGRITSIEHKNGATVRSSKEYSYYPNGLLHVETDKRVNTTTTYTYNSRDLVSQKVHGSLTTGYLYDSLGYIETETRPGNKVVSYSHYPLGELHTIGGAEYPISYVYDPQGRVKTMTTATGTTTWNYDSQRGWLESKTDAATRSVSYKYWPDGSLRTRKNSRGIKTEYTYTAAGDLGKIDYADATPDVVFTYDRRGRKKTIVDAAGTHTLSLNAAGELQTDAISGSGVLAGSAAVASYDALLRRNGFTAIGGNVNLIASTWNYDSVSRLNTVTYGSRTATYDYHAKSPLVHHITFKQGGTTVATTTKTYNANDALTSISTVPVAGGFNANYSYTVVNGVRTEEVLPDGGTWVYGYNGRNEIVSGAKHWGNATGPLVSGQQYAYDFDAIGNRTSTTLNSQSSTYSPNNLNQYDSRTVPGVANILGAVETTATVTVNGSTPTRQNAGAYFNASLNVGNSSSPVFLTTNVSATQSGQTTSVSGAIYVPKTPEAFGYDLDGNLISDGRWNYVWDGENRLVRMEPTSAAITAGVPRQRLNFTYDYMSRRVSKKVETWNGNGYAERSTILFIYDGWNLATEVLSGNGQKLRGYVWGSDVSGGQAAGGVGGLLFLEQQPENKFFVVSSDGRGNVSTLYDATSGSVGAQYEYGPFGELIRSSGAFANLNPLRFSTKYQDQETDTIYYGYRYYKPVFGRWLNQDPIGQQGGNNLYAFIENKPINYFDYLGLLQVDMSLPSVTGPYTYVDEPENPRTGGRTTFSLIVRCSAEKCKVKCKVTATTTSFEINKASTQYKQGEERGIYGHEQRHVQSVINEAKRIEDELKMKEDTFGTLAEARSAAQSYETPLRQRAQDYLDKEASHTNPESPQAGTLYPPL